MSNPIQQPTDRMPLAEFQKARRAVLALFPEPTCHTCTDFEGGLCKQFGEVPAEFQKQPGACEAWRLDLIPF